MWLDCGSGLSSLSWIDRISSSTRVEARRCESHTNEPGPSAAKARGGMIYLCGPDLVVSAPASASAAAAAARAGVAPLKSAARAAAELLKSAARVAPAVAQACARGQRPVVAAAPRYCDGCPSRPPAAWRHRAPSAPG